MLNKMTRRIVRSEVRMGRCCTLGEAIAAWLLSNEPLAVAHRMQQRDAAEDAQAVTGTFNDYGHGDER